MKSSVNRLRQRFEFIYATLRERICMLEYQPNERLSEEVLAEEFAVSRTPLRRVLGRLEAEGLVESRHGVGTFVSDLDIETLEEVYQLRMGLASVSSQLSPIAPSDERLRELRAMIDRCDAIAHLPNSMKEFARLNMDYFQALVEMIGNQPWRQITERLFYQTARIWLAMVPPDKFVEELGIYRREMMEILEALELGDLSSIGHLRHCHISWSFCRLKRYAESARARHMSEIAEV